MRKVAIFVLGAVLAGANLAHAIETGARPSGESSDHNNNDHRRGRTRTLLDCRFVGLGIPLPPPLPLPPVGKGVGKDPSMGAPGIAPVGVPGALPGPMPGGDPGPFPGYPGFGPVGGPLGPVGGPLPGPMGGPGLGLPVPGLGLPVPPLGVGPIPMMNNCAAVARLVDRGHDRDRDGDDWDGDDRFFRNEFAVSCGGVPVYADTAVRSRIDGFEFLTGIVGDPILKVVRDRGLEDMDWDGDYDRNGGNGDHRRRERRSGVLPAWLAIRGNILEGFCAVDRERHRDDDHGHGTTAASNLN